MGETLLTVRRTRRADAVVVMASGEADLLTANLLSEGLSSACAEAGDDDKVVADLTGVTFLGSAGLAELLRCHHRCAEQDTRLQVVVTPELWRVLDIAGLIEVLDVTDAGGEPLG